MDNTFKKLCIRYFRGEISAEETVMLDDSLKDEENVNDMRELEKEWANTQTPTLTQMVAFSRLCRKIHSKTVHRICCIASVVVAVVAVSGLILKHTVYDSAPAVKMHIIESGLKENTKVTLPDGTKVWLNSASRIYYSDSFSKDNREVELSGEAFFDVAKDERHPFTVRLGSNTITVTGTRFDVSAYEKESRISAALVEGSIVFRTECATMDIIPGEVITYSKEDDSITKVHADVDAWTSWMKGSLNLCSFSYTDLFSRLSTIYGKNIEYAPKKYSGNTISVVLNSSESLENVLDALCILTPLKWNEGEDGTITVSEMD